MMDKFISRRDKRQSAQHTAPSSPVWYKRREVVIAGGFALLVVLVGIFLGGVTIAAGSQFTAAENVRKDSKVVYDTVAKRSAALSQKERLAELDAWQASLKASNCQPLVALPWLAEGRKQCDAHNHESTALKKKVEIARRILQYDLHLKMVLAPLTNAHEVKDMQAEANKWQELAKQLTAIPEAEALGDVHTRMVDHAKQISDTWNQLHVANTDKKPAEFREIETSIAGKYTDFQASREDLLKKYAEVQDELQKAATMYY